MTAIRPVLDALSATHRDQLMELAHEVTFPRNSRIFEEDGEADRFWIIRTGAVALDLRVPGLRAPIVATVGDGELLGWSWMFEPYRWHFGADVLGQVEAYEFDAPAVRALCRQDPSFGFAWLEAAAGVVAQRLTAARTRLLALYGLQHKAAAASGRLAPRPAEPGRPTTAARGPSRVKDVMTSAVTTVDRSTPFKEIVETLEEHRVSAAPVLEEDGRVAGVVSQADLLPKEQFHDREPSRLELLRSPGDVLKAHTATAGELMTAPAVAVHGNAPVTEAARLMARHRVKRLPVVDSDGRLVGIISRGDVLKVFLRGDEGIAEDVRREVASHPFLADTPLEVQVHAGVVSLRGEIPEAWLTSVAVRLARSVEGVVDVVPELTAPVPEQGEITPPRVIVYRVVSADRPFRRVEILGAQVGEAHSLADVEELIRRSGITDVDLHDASQVNWVEEGPEVWTD